MQDINTITIAQLEKAMQENINQLGGIDSAIEACDRMYSATFRSEPRKLSTIKWADQCAPYDAIESIYRDAAEKLYTLTTGIKEPVYNEDDHEDAYGYNMEHFSDSAIEWLENTYPDFKVGADSLVVDLCNYKGEIEGGLSLYCLNKSLPVFTCKADSFNAVNY